jgi:hypothetical protein
MRSQRNRPFHGFTTLQGRNCGGAGTNLRLWCRRLEVLAQVEAGAFENFKAISGTRIIDFASTLMLPKFAQSVPRRLQANFGSGYWPESAKILP